MQSPQLIHTVKPIYQVTTVSGIKRSPLGNAIEEKFFESEMAECTIYHVQYISQQLPKDFAED